MWKRFWLSFRSWLKSIVFLSEEEIRAKSREPRPPC